MRIIIISDIHANIVALESVMTKVKVHRPDRIICLGDLVGYGPHPNEVVEYIRNSNILCTLGGADERLAYDFARDKRPRAGVADKTLEWTRTVMEEHNLAYLRNLPVQTRLKTPFGPLRFFHASMKNTQETVRLGKDPIAEKYFQEHRAKILAYGKTHVPQIRKGPFGVVVNPGSVGLSLNGEPGADYAVLDISADKVSVEMDKVEYDFAAVAFEIAAWELPPVVGEAVQQGKMPMDDAKMQRDPSKVRIQTKIVVGRQGRSESAGAESKVIEDKNHDNIEASPSPSSRAVTLHQKDMQQAIEQSAEASPHSSGAMSAAAMSPDNAEIVEQQARSMDAPSLEVQGESAADMLHPDADVSADVPAIADVPFIDIPAEVSQASDTLPIPPSQSHAAVSSVPSSVTSSELAGIDIDDPQEMEDSPARYSDDGMLNLDALEQRHEESSTGQPLHQSDNVSLSTAAQNPAEAQLLAEVEEAHQQEVQQQATQQVAASPAMTPLQADSIEQTIEKRVSDVMLELQRQLKQAVAEADSQGMGAAELQKLQEKTLDLERLKALVLQPDANNQPAANQPAVNQSAPSPQPATPHVPAAQPLAQSEESKAEASKADNFLPSNFFGDDDT